MRFYLISLILAVAPCHAVREKEEKEGPEEAMEGDFNLGVWNVSVLVYPKPRVFQPSETRPFKKGCFKTGHQQSQLGLETPVSLNLVN